MLNILTMPEICSCLYGQMTVFGDRKMAASNSGGSLFEPTPEELNDLARQSMYAGFHKPNVAHQTDDGMTYLERRREEPERDYLAVDDQPYDD